MLKEVLVVPFWSAVDLLDDDADPLAERDARAAWLGAAKVVRRAACHWPPGCALVGGRALARRPRSSTHRS
jgi:hypothetical protein